MGEKVFDLKCFGMKLVCDFFFFNFIFYFLISIDSVNSLK